MSASVIHLRSVVSVIDRFPVLAGADLLVEAGERVLLTGANGAGKTSLLRTVAGLLPLAAGEGEVLGFDLVADAREVRRAVAFASHEAALYAELTVRENVAFAARAARGGSVDDALRTLDLAGRLADLPVQRLSAGQRRRTALATMLVRNRPLWLLDEPHTGLDAHSRIVLDDLIGRAAADGVTVLFTSHEAIAHDLADRHVEVVGGTCIEQLTVLDSRLRGNDGVGRGNDEAAEVIDVS